MTDRELMQQALEALNRSDYLGWQINIPIIKALRERLAQSEDEPVVFNTISSLRHKKTVGPIESAMTGRPQTAMQPCAGRNCGSTNPNLHSAECFEDYEKSTGMNEFKPDWDTVKAFDDRHNEATAEIERLTKLCYDYLGELTALRAVGQMRESRQWVGLTEEEISAVDWKNDETLHDFARAIEAKLKEKNT